MALALILGAWLGGEQRSLADQVVRLHVIANSDSAEDQALKLAVRDGVLSRRRPFIPPTPLWTRPGPPWRAIWTSWRRRARR